MREFAKAFYHSMAWKQAREDYMKSRRGLCERCLTKGLIVPAQIVHHKVHLTPENIGDENITLNAQNFEALCRNCHADEHADIYVGRDFPNAKRIKKRYKVDGMGRVTII